MEMKWKHYVGIRSLVALSSLIATSCPYPTPSFDNPYDSKGSSYNPSASTQGFIVYGGTEALLSQSRDALQNGLYHPELFGATLLGSSKTSAWFPGTYSYYAVTSRQGDYQVDAVLDQDNRPLDAIASGNADGSNILAVDGKSSTLQGASSSVIGLRPPIGHAVSGIKVILLGDTAESVGPTATPIATPTMVDVQGGNFNNGISDVTVSSFRMSATEITQAQYQVVTGSNSSHFVGDSSRPVDSVSWYDAVEFCNKLSERDGLSDVYAIAGRTPATGFPITSATVTMDMTKNGYRLPTEAEWEFAARGGNLTRGYTYAGSNTIDDVAWYVDNSGNASHSVGTKAANELGLYDMCGNVREWCWDWYGAYSNGTTTDPTGPSSGPGRVGRGGNLDVIPNYCTASYRFYYIQSSNPIDFGFRVVSRNSALAGTTFSPAAGTYSTDQSVTISCATPGSTIYYTTDGTTPTTGSTKYTGAIAVVGNGTSIGIKAVAFVGTASQSSVGNADYVINYPATAMPTFDPPGGSYSTDQSVTLSCATSGATIYYTTDGTMPTTSSTVYSGPLAVAGDATRVTIKAVAESNTTGLSAVVSAVYAIQSPVSALPLLSGAWSVLASMNEGRCDMGIGNDGTMIYAEHGGAGIDSQMTIEKYDIAVNLWTPLANTGWGSSGQVYAIYGSSLFYDFGPWFEIFDTSTGLSHRSTIGPESSERRFGMPGNTRLGDIIYVVGGTGVGNPAYQQDTWAYHISTDSWTTGLAAASPGIFGAAVAHAGKIYRLGGFDGTHILDLIEAYDPSSNTWVVQDHMPGAIDDFTACSDGSLYLYYINDYSDQIIRYNPVAHSFARLPPLPIKMRGPGLIVVSGTLYVIGGADRALNVFTSCYAMPLPP